MSIRIDANTPTPPLGPSELDNGIMSMRVLVGLIAFVMFLVLVAAAISAGLWFILR